MKSFYTLLFLCFLSSCVSVKDQKNGQAKSQKLDVEKVSFSVVSTKTKNNDLYLMGSSPNCSIKWTLNKGILTHRMNCRTQTKDELWAYLLGMASKLKEVNRAPIYFVRYTSSDFPNEEAYLGKIFSKSKMWTKLNKKNINQKKYRDFSNKFLTRVIEKKGVLSMVPKALNQVGYAFDVDAVEIKNYKMQKNKVLRPSGAKVVFKSRALNSSLNRAVKP